MNPAPLLVAALLAAATPAAADLAVHPPLPPQREAPGLSEVTFQVPVRTDADRLHVEARGDPVGAAALAPADGGEGTWTPLSAAPTLDLPPEGGCWRGWCDVHNVTIRLLAPNHDGSSTTIVGLEADGARVLVPLHVETHPRAPVAVRDQDLVRVEVPHARTLDRVALQGPDAAWPAQPARGGFAVPVDDLPRGTPLVPALDLRNGTTVRGEAITLPEAPFPAGGDDGGNGTDPPGPPGSGTDGTEEDPPDDPEDGGSASESDGLHRPRAPAKAGDEAAPLPRPAWLPLAALAVALGMRWRASR